MLREVEYFEKAGRENTDKCVEIVKRYARDYTNVVTATTSGATGLKFAEELQGKDIDLLVVTHTAGFKEPNSTELNAEKAERIRQLSATIYTGTMPTRSIEKSFVAQSGGVYPTDIVAQSLRRLGQGVKVCCEIVMQGCDAGLLPEGKPILAAGGTKWGADTVCVVRGAVSHRFTDLQVMEILAKPRQW